MSQFVRMIYHSIVDFFVQQAEDSCYCRDQLLKDSPYLLSHGELDCLSGNIPEETSDCLVITEAFCNRENIVLQTAKCGGGNLRCEAGALALAESKVGLAILEYHFKSPTSGIHPPCLEEIHCGIGCEQTVPFAMFSTPHKKDSYRDSAECGIKHDIFAFELAAILLQLEFFAKLHKSGSREVSMFSMIFCLAVLADLYHAEPMAFYVAAMDEPDNILVGEPAVRQDIAELYTFAYCPLYHFFGKFYLGHVVFLLPLTKYLAVMFRCMTSFEFFGAHAVVAVLSLLSNDGEVKEKLRYSIGGCHAETFEAKHRLVCKMRINSSDFFNTPACFLMVGIVKNQTYLIGFMVRTQMYPVPQLYRYMPESLSPVYIGIFHEPIEDILSGLNQRIKYAVLLIAVCVFDAKAWKKKKTLEHGKQPVDAVAPACDGKSVALGHLDLSENGTYVLHGGCHIRIFEKVFDIREERSNFVYRHGLEYFFVWYLKFTHFLAIRQESMSIFYAFISPNQYLRNLNQMIDRDYQLVCLLAKADTIEQSLRRVGEKYYRKESFLFVINTGLNTNIDFRISFAALKNELIKIYNVA